MEIYLLRHGIAENHAPGGRDSDRALTAEGREKLTLVLKRARLAGALPGVILSSPYRRAVETAELAAQTLEYHGTILKTKALTPDASPQDAWAEICLRPEEEAILVASHEPLMSSMTAFLLASPALQVDMKKGAMVCVECSTLSGSPRGVLKWMLTASSS